MTTEWPRWISGEARWARAARAAVMAVAVAVVIATVAYAVDILPAVVHHLGNVRSCMSSMPRVDTVHEWLGQLQRCGQAVGRSTPERIIVTPEEWERAK